MKGTRATRSTDSIDARRPMALQFENHIDMQFHGTKSSQIAITVHGELASRRTAANTLKIKPLCKLFNPSISENYANKKD